MPISRSLDDLPPIGSSGQAGGWAPDGTPRFAQLLATKWHAENMAAGTRPHAIEGTRFRHSDAGGCARKIAYKAAGFEVTNPMDVTGSWNTRLGTLIHDAWQEELLERLSGAFAFEGIGMEADLYARDGALMMQGSGQEAFRLQWQGGLEFRADFDPSVRVLFAEDGASLVLHQRGRKAEGVRKKEG